MTAKATSVGDEFMFSRGYRDPARLHLAHWLWKETTGYLLHPSIAVTSPTCAIADVGTANAAWLLELVQHSPASWRLHGSDVSGANFPHPHYLPDNVSLQILDISEEVPREMTGAFDIVHVRALANVVKGGNPEYLIADLSSWNITEPGGFLQWDEFDSNTFAGHHPAGKGSKENIENLISVWYQFAKKLDI